MSEREFKSVPYLSAVACSCIFPVHSCTDWSTTFFFFFFIAALLWELVLVVCTQSYQVSGFVVHSSQLQYSAARRSLI